MSSDGDKMGHRNSMLMFVSQFVFPSLWFGEISRFTPMDESETLLCVSP